MIHSPHSFTNEASTRADLGLGMTIGSSPLIFTHFAGRGSGPEPRTQSAAFTLGSSTSNVIKNSGENTLTSSNSLTTDAAMLTQAAFKLFSFEIYLYLTRLDVLHCYIHCRYNSEFYEVSLLHCKLFSTFESILIKKIFWGYFETCRLILRFLDMYSYLAAKTVNFTRIKPFTQPIIRKYS